MAPARSLKCKAFFVDEGALRRAKKALGVATDAETVRLSVERVAEMERFWRFMEHHAPLAPHRGGTETGRLPGRLAGAMNPLEDAPMAGATKSNTSRESAIVPPTVWP